jgi:hypothetical protein
LTRGKRRSHKVKNFNSPREFDILEDFSMTGMICAVPFLTFLSNHFIGYKRKSKDLHSAMFGSNHFRNC